MNRKGNGIFFRTVYWESAVGALQREGLELVALLRRRRIPAESRIREVVGGLYFRLAVEMGPEIDLLRESLEDDVVQEYDRLCGAFGDLQREASSKRWKRNELWTMTLEFYDRCCGLLDAVRTSSGVAEEGRAPSRAAVSVSF